MSSLKLLVRRLKSIFVPNSFDQVNIFYSSTCASKYAGSSSPVHGNEPLIPKCRCGDFMILLSIL